MSEGPLNAGLGAEANEILRNEVYAAGDFDNRELMFLFRNVCGILLGALAACKGPNTALRIFELAVKEEHRNIRIESQRSLGII